MRLNLEDKIAHFHMQLDTNIDTNIIKNIFSKHYTKCILRYNRLTIKLEEIFQNEKSFLPKESVLIV